MYKKNSGEGTPLPTPSTRAARRLEYPLAPSALHTRASTCLANAILGSAYVFS